MKLAAVLVLALALPACAAVYAEGPSTTSKTGGEEEWYSGSPTGKKEYGRHGGYGAVGLDQGLELFDLPGGVSTDNSDLGFAIRGGYRTEEGLALEGSIESVTGYTVGDGAAQATLDFSSLCFAGKYYILRERVQPYALLGAGFTWVDTKYTDYDTGAVFVRLGAGLDIYLTKDIAVFGEVNFNRMTGDLKNLDHLNVVLGILFRF